MLVLLSVPLCAMFESSISAFLVSDNVPYIADIILFVLLLAVWRYRWRDYFLAYRMFRKNKESLNPVSMSSSGVSASLMKNNILPPHVSVVIPCCNQAHSLKRNLPIVLGQNYTRYEVIVVDESSTDETQEVLTLMGQQYPNLRHTFVPATTRYVSRRKLAVTLGIRAARAPWVLLTYADAYPQTSDWIRFMAAAMSDEVDFVLGPADYEDNGGRFSARAIYGRRCAMVRNLRAACSGHAVGADGANWAVRKSYFMECNGYADTLTLPLGEADSLVVAISRKNKIAWSVHPQASVCQQLPMKEILRNDSVAQREVLSRLGRWPKLYLLREGMASFVVYWLVLLFVSYLIFRSYAVWSDGQYALRTLYADVLAFLLVISGIGISFVARRRLSIAVGGRRFGFCFIVLYALTQPFRNLYVKVLHYRCRKEFVRR